MVTAETVYQLKIHLCGITPMVWRRVLAQANTSIALCEHTKQTLAYKGRALQDSSLNEGREVFGHVHAGDARPTCGQWTDGIKQRSALSPVEGTSA